MSRHATELCLLLVDDMFGDVTSRVFGILVNLGRLALPAIIHHTRFSPRQVKTSLAVLVQQHLATWYLSPEDDIAYYEANSTNAYLILQLGKYASLVEQRLGKGAASIISELLLSGHARVDSLERAYNELQKVPALLKPKANGININGYTANGVIKKEEGASKDGVPFEVGGGKVASTEGPSEEPATVELSAEAETPAELAPAEITPKEATPSKIASVKVDPAEVALGEATSSKVAPMKVEPAEVAPADISLAKSAPAKTAPLEVSSLETAQRDIGSGEAAPAEGRPENAVDDFFTALKSLVERRYLSVIHDSHFRSDADNRKEAENLIYRRLPTEGPLKGSDKIKFEASVAELLREWKFGTERSIEATERKILASAASKGKKRAAQNENGDDEPAKKKRLNNGDAQVLSEPGDNSDEPELDHAETVVVVNVQKLSVVARSERLVLEAEKQIGKVTSIVYSKLLQRVEKDILSCKFDRKDEGTDTEDEDDGDCGTRVSTRDMLDELKDMRNLSDSIATIESYQINMSELMYSRKRRRKENMLGETGSGPDSSSDEQPWNSDSEDADDVCAVTNGDHAPHLSKKRKAEDIDPQTESRILPPSRVRLEQARQHLFLLSSHNPPFLTYHHRTASTPESWSVPFTSLIHQLRLLALFSTISARHGKPALRLARILHEKGKLDEKALTSLSLLNQKSMRSALATMHAAGFLELQEIPRDNNRQPSRTLFLWFFDPRRCTLQACDGAYKAMARLLQRLAAEREAMKGVLSKAERSDVEGREAEFLTPAEMGALERWREVEARIWGEVGRLDDFVCLLRDF